jgi:GTP cyclohydrolase I
LSKIPRLVHAFARRLQIQEQLTKQVAHTLFETLGCQGAACVIKAQHSCMAMRGVRADAQMVTSAQYGVFREDPAVRDEFLQLLKL